MNILKGIMGELADEWPTYSRIEKFTVGIAVALLMILPGIVMAVAVICGDSPHSNK